MERTQEETCKIIINYYVRGPICKWNIHEMQSKSIEHARKTTGFLTNSWRIQINLAMQRKFGREIG